MKVIIIRYSEIHLKGNNRDFFESILISNIKHVLSDYDYQFGRSNARYVIRNFDENYTEQILDAVKNVFGVYSVSPAEEVPSTYEDISSAALSMAPVYGTFKVNTNRADKRFPIPSMKLSADIGGKILEQNPTLKVDLFHPDTVVSIDIRENGKTFVYSEVIKGVNGMPVGTAGKGIIMLSGGIDSPVAMYMMAKRGMTLRSVHFHSFPYTSMQAKQKVLDLAKIVKKYTLHMTVDVVSFTEIQTAIHEKCPEEYMITIMRRFMMRIAEKLAQKHGAGAVITGESLGQVASQTLESITSTNSVATLPVFRPLIGFDKDEIIEIAQKIGTFETSILPYEDCCTIFLPKKPVTKPRLSAVLKVESALDVETLVNNALQNIEVVEI
ncbi:MAG: tRNA 4-thiouridine(8) synthase ThiI [Clostridia bacterium]|nr:tRNA 4-thiouridine(8) synthase ThiI [Clostridia bacterium]MBQ4272808.1 tRNA 4-thiouridine(8) synthase ThiI [Clostridia bacterium]